jgi:hypothetical protein
MLPRKHSRHSSLLIHACAATLCLSVSLAVSLVHVDSFCRALEHFKIVMGVCAVSLIFSTGCYCVAEPSPSIFGSVAGKKDPPVAGWRKARRSYGEILIQ